MTDRDYWRNYCDDHHLDFLHDIIKSLRKSTGYALQFLDENKDITNASIKDAKFKYYFLSKLMNIISALYI